MNYAIFNWNIARSSDYLALCLRNKEKFTSVSELSARRLEKLSEIFQSTIKDFHPDFFTIQECEGPSHLGVFLGDDYEVAGEIRDCAIPWKKEKFTKVKDTHQQYFSVVWLKDQSNDRVIKIASAHLPGFDLSDPEEKEWKKGDQVLEKLMEEDFDILGMDANTTPNIHPERLKIVEDSGFTRTGDRETSYNDSLEKKVQLDYVYARGGNFTEVKDFPDYPLEDPQNNPSDHRPIFFHV